MAAEGATTTALMTAQSQRSFSVFSHAALNRETRVGVPPEIAELKFY